MAVRGARPTGRWVWWALALLTLPAALATVAVLGPGRAGVVVAPAAGPDRDAAGALTTVAAPTGARPTPVDHGPAEHERLAALLTDRPIVFTADSAELTAPAATAVQETALLLSALPGVPVLVEGHAADTPGRPEAAQRLSERRADVVAAALAAGGVTRERIATRGRGAEVPLATVAESRRVEISIR